MTMAAPCNIDDEVVDGELGSVRFYSSPTRVRYQVMTDVSGVNPSSTEPASRH